MKLIMFCQNRTQLAHLPGKAATSVQLALPPKTDKVDDENPGVFEPGVTQNATFTASGLSEEVLKEFSAGKRAKVTIEFID